MNILFECYSSYFLSMSYYDSLNKTVLLYTNFIALLSLLYPINRLSAKNKTLLF